MSITSVFTIGHCAMLPPLQNPKYASDVNMPSQTKWRNVGWKTSTFFIQRLQTFFFYFCHVFYIYAVDVAVLIVNMYVCIIG